MGTVEEYHQGLSDHIENMEDDETPFIPSTKSGVVLMNDCHYYIPQMSIGGQIYVSGLEFEKATGHFYLPANEGEYSVSIEDEEGTLMNMVSMCPRGTDRPYSHPNVSFKEKDVVIDYGWI